MATKNHSPTGAIYCSTNFCSRSKSFLASKYRADRAVSSAEQYANIKIQRLRMIQLAIFGSSLLLSIVLLMTINKITSNLEGSIDNISVSAETIAAVLVSQGKSSGLQVVTVDTATQIVRGLQDFTQQSSTTAQMSVDLIDRTLESIQQIARFTRQNSVEMYIAILNENLAT